MATEMLNISGDVGIKVSNSDIVSTLQETCVSMYNLITDIQNIEISQSIEIHLEEDSIEALVVCLLNELLFIFDTNGFVGRLVNIDLSETGGIFKIKASVKGEIFNPQKHQRKLLIKAATYHNLSVIIEEDYCMIQVVFDI
ncbi:MAG: archease [Thermodesulfovibrionales bacterium]|nr:archease [Thermodesulfovibrionales bacterium]